MEHLWIPPALVPCLPWALRWPCFSGFDPLAGAPSAYPPSAHSLILRDPKVGASSPHLSSWKCGQHLSWSWPYWLQPSLTAGLTCLFPLPYWFCSPQGVRGRWLLAYKSIAIPVVPCSQGPVDTSGDAHHHTLTHMHHDLLFSAGFPFLASFLGAGSKIKGKGALVWEEGGEKHESE